MSKFELLVNEEHPLVTRFSAEHATEVSYIDAKRNTGDNKVKTDAPGDFLTMFDEIWIRLLQLAKQLRDVMRLYNEKKQILGWQLEVNTLAKSFEAIDSSYNASWYNALGNVTNGSLMFAGGFIPLFDKTASALGKISPIAGNAFGQMANGVTGYFSASDSRNADGERSVADLQSKGSQAYTRNLDEIVQKAREIMQQMMELGRSMVDIFSQTLRALTRQ